MQNLHFARQIPTGLSYVLGSDRSFGSPIFVTIETVNSCNLRCVYCPQSMPGHHAIPGRGLMSLETFRLIVDKLAQDFPLRAVALHRDGEPLLNPSLEDCVRFLTARGIHASFSSNCTLLDRERAESLISAGLQMVNTDFSNDKLIFEELRRGADWDAVHHGITHLLEAARARGARFDFVVKEMSPDPDAVERTRRLFAHWAERVTVIPTRFHNALNQARVGRVETGAHAGARYTLCHQPWVNFTVDYRGKVLACCRDLRSEFVVGDLLRQSAREIWNGPGVRRVRRALRARRPEEIPTCASCDAPYTGSYSGRSFSQKAVSFLFRKAWAR